MVGNLRLQSERRLERETGFEPATSTLARSHSTTELFPLAVNILLYQKDRDRGKKPACFLKFSTARNNILRLVVHRELLTDYQG